MERSVLASVLVIGVVAAMLGAGTMAFFNDTETSEGNILQAGTLDLKVDDLDDDPIEGYLMDEEGDPIVYVALEDMAPCQWVGIGPIALTNTGTIDGIADLHFANVEDDDDGVSSEPEEVADPNSEIYDISVHIWVDIWYDANRNSESDDGEVIYGDYEVTLAELECIDIFLGELLAGESADLYLSFHLDDEVGNEYQGDCCTFDIEFSLVQA